jgi:hypothetical protein
MAQAKQIINIIEGFKLGSLGVSRNPVIPKEIPEKVKILRSHWIQEKSSFLWEQITPRDLLKMFKVPVEETKSIFSAVLSIQESFIISPTTKSLFMPLLVINVWDSKRTKVFEANTFLYEKFEATSKIEGVSWLRKQMATIRTEGIAALHFPENWIPESHY